MFSIKTVRQWPPQVAKALGVEIEPIMGLGPELYIDALEGAAHRGVCVHHCTPRSGCIILCACFSTFLHSGACHLLQQMSSFARRRPVRDHRSAQGAGGWAGDGCTGQHAAGCDQAPADRDRYVLSEGLSCALLRPPPAPPPLRAA